MSTKTQPLTPYKPKRPRVGLGDVVEIVAQPVAKAIDAVAGTDLQNCGGCAGRKDKLNAISDAAVDAAKGLLA